jgi:hypothetical protein
MSATWRKERSRVERNEIMKTAAHRSESWCWRQLHAADRAARLGMILFCASRLRHQCSRNSTSVCYRHDVMSSTREDVMTRRYLLLRCADSSLNHEWSKTASLSHVLMLVLTQLVCGRPKAVRSSETSVNLYWIDDVTSQRIIRLMFDLYDFYVQLRYEYTLISHNPRTK